MLARTTQPPGVVQMATPGYPPGRGSSRIIADHTPRPRPETVRSAAVSDDWDTSRDKYAEGMARRIREDVQRFVGIVSAVQQEFSAQLFCSLPLSLQLSTA